MVPAVGLMESFKQRARTLKRETHALYLAARDPRTPWIARLVVALVAAYALSPIDLIPDFIPVVGLLDDLVVVPLGIMVAVQLVPAEVMADCREQARQAESKPVSRTGVALIVGVWLLVGLVLVLLIRGLAG
jgi:uncharacterized membrane protein YkvA (DUF1232 family)